ncbi:eukaryotic translation initiation factor SUI1 family protein [Marasmius fiardii PR-910]|nr:eukaryotic translation initiation factor SUI1 family protein [Marasmius fiardii PR-910]
MFKKPLGNLKTSAPLRNSDRKKLKQRVVSSFSIQNEDADVLVPEGILSVKFSTHLNERGVAYLAPEGNPLWFTIGKGSEDLIPTVYTLWKSAKLLPFLSTPKAVIPILVGGADLMIPGVVHHTLNLSEGQLVSVCKYEKHNGVPTLSPPLAVGRMAVSSDQLADGGKEKGKAVWVLHTWKDHLWGLGSKEEPPEDVPIQTGTQAEGSTEEVNDGQTVEDQPAAIANATDKVEDLSTNDNQLPESGDHDAETAQSSSQNPTYTYTPDEISTLLYKSLLQALATSLSNLPPSSFPITSTSFNTTHILPARPNFPSLVLLPSATAGKDIDPRELDIDPRELTIKSSSHKSLTAFLKSADKAGLITTKTPSKNSGTSDLFITSVNPKHSEVQGHKVHVTVGEVEAKSAKKAKREEMTEKEKEKEKAGLDVQELWKPHGSSVGVFEAMDASLSNLYTLSEVRDLINGYITSQDLVNKFERAYINLNPVLLSCVSAKSPGKTKKGGGAQDSAQQEGEPEFMKRDELMKKIVGKMQSWYAVVAEGKEVVPKKGQLKSIDVTTKVRQGRKACTLITGFEPFHINAEEMSEDLRKVCAGATSVSPIPGRPAGSGMEVLVQGKQGKAVYEYLLGKGVPKKWIEVHDIAGKK